MNDVWAILEFAYTKEFVSVSKKRRKRNYWKVQCNNCGVIRFMEKHNLKPPSGGKCQNCWGRPQGQAGLVELFSSYKRNADNNNREFKIDETQFNFLTKQPCHYCGNFPNVIRRGGTSLKSRWGDYLYNGLDRVDNNFGYIESNVVPCCMICNRAKSDMTYDAFMLYISRIKSR